MSPSPMNCIVCSRPCEVLWEGAKGDNIPAMHDGVVCFSYGNYGSTVFDPMGGTCLRFALCDGCLAKKAKDILKIEFSRKSTVEEHSRHSFTEHMKDLEAQ